MTVDNVMDKEEWQQEDVEQQQEELISENISLERPTRKHFSLILESLLPLAIL